jgi:hypothetical protein
MSGYVSLESRLPPLWQSSPSPVPSPVLRQVESPEPASAPAPQLTDMAISRILTNAESLIASVTGLRTQEVQVSVNLARYEF